MEQARPTLCRSKHATSRNKRRLLHRGSTGHIKGMNPVLRLSPELFKIYLVNWQSYRPLSRISRPTASEVVVFLPWFYLESLYPLLFVEEIGHRNAWL